MIYGHSTGLEDKIPDMVAMEMCGSDFSLRKNLSFNCFGAVS